MKRRVVLLHGWASSIVKLESLGQELERFGWKVCIPKLPGFDSPVPSKVWGNEEYADFVAKEAQQFYRGEKYFVFGHSFGGGVAIRCALKHPKSLQGLILCSSGRITKPDILKKTLFFFLAKAGKVLDLVPTLAGIYRRILYKLAREHDYEKTQGIMKEVFKKVVADNLRHFVHRIKLPTLILWGQNDKMTPISDALYLERKIAGSQLRVYQNVGHRLPYEKPGEVALEINKWFNSLK